jgi:hypothetical protein
MKRNSRNQNRQRNRGHQEAQPTPQIPAPIIPATIVAAKKTLTEKIVIWSGVILSLGKAAEIIIDHWP